MGNKRLPVQSSRYRKAHVLPEEEEDIIIQAREAMLLFIDGFMAWRHMSWQQNAAVAQKVPFSKGSVFLFSHTTCLSVTSSNEETHMFMMRKYSRGV